MKTISLRTLVREPIKVKRMTRAGKPEAERRRAIDEILDEVLHEKPSNISAAKLLEESRR